jgi:hypothetical protein
MLRRKKKKSLLPLIPPESGQIGRRKFSLFFFVSFLESAVCVDAGALKVPWAGNIDILRIKAYIQDGN